MTRGRSDSSTSLGVGAPGLDVSGPPWILGWRGAPLEAPENTAASFLRALEAGLDGIQYDLRSCDGGDPVVLRDRRLDRTTDSIGAVAETRLTELFACDAGGWFSKYFAGEPIPHLDDVLGLDSSRVESPIHFVELHEPELCAELGQRLAGIHPPLSLRVASERRELCLDLRDVGFQAVLIADEAGAADLAFVRDERLEGLAVTTPRGWSNEAGRTSWPCERWILGIGEADDLFEALRAGVHGMVTAEGRRALALRALFALLEKDPPRPPLEADSLAVLTSSAGEAGGEWRGEWNPRVRLFNPFPFSCQVKLQLFVRKGAFEFEGLPREVELAGGESETVHFRLRGGSWSPGGDPVVAALFEWDAGPGRAAGNLMFDVSLRRERTAVADVITQRLEMLRESPGDSRATMTIARRAGRLSLRVENPGELQDLHCVASLAGRTWYGGASLQLPLPEKFDSLEHGVEFSCGFEGKRPNSATRQLRRWCGGLPVHPGNGAPGRLISRRFS